MERFFTETQRMVRDIVRRFAQDRVLPRAAAIDRDDRFPDDLYAEMAALGLFGISLPEEAGGSGDDTATLAIATEELARCSGSVGNIYALPTEAVTFLHVHGTPEQKTLIPGILAGRLIPASCASEPDHGSDVAAMTTTAMRDGDHYVIDGTKAWVSLGQVANLVFVFAKTDPKAGHRGISCFIVDGDNPGMRRGKKEKLMGMRGLGTCQIVFENCRVPASRLIGPLNGAFKMAMQNFNYSRIVMGSMSLGIAQAAYEDALAYAKTRVQFGQPIIEFQAVQFMLADMATDIAAARLLIHHACRLHDAGHSTALEAAQLKLFTTDMAMKHVSNALQIHGGYGYSQEYRVERLFRDIKLPQIYEGTNQIQRVIIARQIAKAG